ncbi:50S ribosomal protein L4, partial [Candidatus Woesearchaeota archaeon]|nr:50S ribosomal protein L4 [Candidatus Woesearchaeota archaeon]
MELKIITTKNEEKGKKSLPSQFSEELRPDLIYRAVMTLQANKRQKYGASPEAGKRASAFLSKRRRKYRGTYGIGQSRTPRKVLTRRGTRMYYVGAFAPQTVGGRRAHPPKAGKDWSKKINKKENKKAIRSALSAVVQQDIVKERGHLAP